MAARHIYIVDEDREVILDRFDVSTWTETQIRELEHRIRARSAQEGIVIRDSAFDPPAD